MEKFMGILMCLIFFFFIGKQIALKKRKGAPEHTGSIQKGYQNKRKTKTQKKSTRKTQKQKKSYIKTPTSCL
jgi:hypothetical protein